MALATAGDDGRVVVWRAETLEMLEEVRFPGPVHALAFSADGLMLATGNADGTVALLLLPALVPPPPAK
jgi:WD40 repeat protein